MRDGSFEELAEAVYRGDLATGVDVLDFMQGSGFNAEAIRRAKRAARPELRADIAGAECIPLPQPGRTPAEVFGPGGTWPRATRKYAGKPKRNRAA